MVSVGMRRTGLVGQQANATGEDSRPEGQPEQINPTITVLPVRGHGGENKSGAAPSQSPRNQAGGGTTSPEISFIEALLIFEAKVRAAETVGALKYLLANEIGSLINCGQVLVHRKQTGALTGALDVVSSISQLDRTSPTIVWLEKEIRDGVARNPQENTDSGEASQFRIRAKKAPAGAYPFSHCLHVPLAWENTRGQKIQLGALSLLGTEKLDDRDVVVAKRVCGTVSHAMLALSPRRPLSGGAAFGKFALIAALCVILLGFVPVPLTVLAPVELVGRNQAVVAAPLNGVIEKVHVRPGEQVVPGTPLFSYVKTDFSSDYEVARQKMLVAAARYNKARQQSFGSGEGRRELAVSQAELELAQAEFEHANSRLKLADVHAESAGVAMFSNASQWTGKPVSTGERIIRVADPADVEFRIDLPVSDAIVLEQNAKARIFLDVNPLNALEVDIVSRNYEAAVSDRDILAFTLMARLADNKREKDLTLGLRGTAQIFGKTVSLGFFVFRKPLSAIRQYFGF